MLPPKQQEELRDWLENLLEDQLEWTDEFKAKIERGEQLFPPKSIKPARG